MNNTSIQKCEFTINDVFNWAAGLFKIGHINDHYHKTVRLVVLGRSKQVNTINAGIISEGFIYRWEVSHNDGIFSILLEKIKDETTTVVESETISFDYDADYWYLSSDVRANNAKRIHRNHGGSVKISSIGLPSDFYKCLIYMISGEFFE